ncbi:heat shock (predicted periplasmic) protein YciM [Halorhodospira halochloris]|uniref:Lipopolysaccharide assembly protein B n=1 Tax=Halorhodospira halochloris TaxID=1052 RepID=A0A0X8X971_HALHR|nr:lipopolysaccharide assembly protein LapB [Halorhodospira halochloris]MBK1651479.1 lipopolysaccharide assembly protein LapB [Halorhodospira halochloris]BAU57258.1 heat shock (predicted periplasmic) protein YciM [Halorhodospira halochloris]
MHELMWLLLPVAALTGWVVGRREAASVQGSGRRGSIPDSYLQGINYLLNDERDKALEVFTQMAEIDSETAEAHLALGSLFRRRGEVDRAIQIHQNLVARPNLTTQQRIYALLALGEDFMKAGLFDRAEEVFGKVIEQDAHVEQALRNLLTIYEHEKEWSKAIDVAQRLDRISNRDYRDSIAQLHCELAAAAMAEGEVATVREQINKALKVDRGCVRANILRGDLEREQKRCRAAIKAYKAVARQDLAMVPEIVDGLDACFEAQGTPERLEGFLREVINQYPDGRLVARLAEIVSERRGTHEALNELTGLLRRHPTLVGIRRLVSLAYSMGQPIDPRDLQILLGLFDRLEAIRSLYRCKKCGFSSRSLFWHCPGCKQWASMRPVEEI